MIFYISHANSMKYLLQDEKEQILIKVSILFNPKLSFSVWLYIYYQELTA